MRWTFAGVAALCAVPIVGLLGYGMTKDPAAIPSPLPGRAAPTFALAAFTSGSRTPQYTGTIPAVDSVRLADLRGQVVVLNFYASWCLACRAEHAVLQEVASRYVNTDVKFEGVLYNDVPANALQWLSEMGPLPFPSLSDPDARTAIDYGLYGVPETFFIDRDGRVATKQVGPVTDSMLVAEIETLRHRAPATAGETGATIDPTTDPTNDPADAAGRAAAPAAPPAAQAAAPRRSTGERR